MASSPIIFSHHETLDMVAIARKLVAANSDTIALVQYIGNDNDSITLYSKVSDVVTQIQERWSSEAYKDLEHYDDALSLHVYKYIWHIFGLKNIKYADLIELLHFNNHELDRKFCVSRV